MSATRPRNELASARQALAQTEVDRTLALVASVEARAAEARFRGFVEAADDFFFRTDAERPLHLPEPRRRSKRSATARSTCWGASFLDVVRADYREQAQRFYDDQRRQQIPNTYCEFPMRTRAGADLWVGQRVQLVLEDGRFAGLQALARDVTERNLAEQALERERQQLRQIVTHAPVAMAMLDRDARYVAHSARWLRFLGVKEPSVVGRTVPRGHARDPGALPRGAGRARSPARS